MRPSMFSVAVPEPSLPTPPLFSGSLPSLALLSVLACSPLLLMRGAAAQTVQTPDAPGGSWIAPRAPGSLPLPTPIEESDAPDRPVAPRFTAPPPPMPVEPPGAVEAPAAGSAQYVPRPNGPPISLAPPQVPSRAGTPPAVANGPVSAGNQAATAEAVAFLRAAREELAAGRAREAGHTLEMAQTRLLSRTVDSGRETQPSDDPGVRRISEALSAIAGNDRAAAARAIDQALRTLMGGGGNAAGLPPAGASQMGAPQMGVAKPGAAPVDASSVPAVGVAGEPSPTDLLRAARVSLATHRLDEARQSLEMAQTRLLSRVVDKGRENRPSDDAAVRQISEALAALAANDRMTCLRYIETASKTLGVTLD